MVELPYELWLQITQYLPGHAVTSLMSVNRSLYNIALDERYKVVIWEKLDMKMMIRSLTSLRWCIRLSFFDSSRVSDRVVQESLDRRSRQAPSHLCLEHY